MSLSTLWIRCDLHSGFGGGAKGWSWLRADQTALVTRKPTLHLLSCRSPLCLTWSWGTHVDPHPLHCQSCSH